jgi:HEAT repeat protein
LAPLAEDEDWQVRYRLVLALGQLAHPDRQSLLQKLAQDSAEQVAVTAQELLAA